MKNENDFGNSARWLVELISAVRSINRAPHHKVMVDGDDEPCYWQRQEWVEWILELADDAEEFLNTPEHRQSEVPCGVSDGCSGKSKKGAK